MSTIRGISSPCNVALWRKQERRKTAVLFSTHRVGRQGKWVRWGNCAAILRSERDPKNSDRKDVEPEMRSDALLCAVDEGEASKYSLNRQESQ